MAVSDMFGIDIERITKNTVPPTIIGDLRALLERLPAV
jgi:hypothetical protein